MNDSILPSRGLVVTLGMPRGPKRLCSLSQPGVSQKVLQFAVAASEKRFAKMIVLAKSDVRV
jgi:hypothetical protein